MPTSPDSKLARAAFQYPDFTAYAIARFCIVVAQEMQSVAVGWQVYEITTGRSTLAWWAWRNFSPAFFFCPPVTPSTGSIAARSSWPATAASPSVPLCCSLRCVGRLSPADLRRRGAARHGPLFQFPRRPRSDAATRSRRAFLQRRGVEFQHLQGARSGALPSAA